MNCIALIGTVLFVTPAFAGGDFWSTTAFHAINLIILLVLLVRIAGPKVKEGMKSRSESVSRDITDAEKRNEEAQAQLQEYEGKLRALEADAKQLLDEYRELGERERDRIRAEAEADAERIRTEARQLAARELQNAKLSIERDVVMAALDKAEVQIKAQLTNEDRQRLVSGYFVELEAAISDEGVVASDLGDS